MVNALAVAPNTPGVMYAGTNGGVYFTRDDGAHWTLASKGLPDDQTITALAVSNDSKVVFAGTHKGVFRTRDGGASWTMADPRFGDQFILSLLIHPQIPATVYVGTATTILRSDNGGDTWSDVGEDLNLARIWAMAAVSSTVFAAADTGIYSSVDRGDRWQSSSDGLPVGAHPQALAATAHGLLAGTSQGLFASPDGKSWSAVVGPLDGQPVRSIAIDPHQPDRIFAATEQGVAASTDGGSSWNAPTEPPGVTSILSLAAGDQNALYAGTLRGVLKSVDESAHWQYLNTGLASTSVHALVLVPGNPARLLAATRYGLEVSLDRGATWQEARGITDPYVLSVAMDPVDPARVYAGTWGSSLYLSKDGGIDFAPIADNLAGNAPISSVAILHLADEGLVLYAGTLGNGLYESHDGGQNWNVVTTLVGATRVMALVFVPPSALYAGTERGLYRLSVTAANPAWLLESSSLPTDEVRAVLYDPGQTSPIYVGYATSGVYRSDDAGAHWKPVGGATLPIPARLQAMAFNPASPNAIYVGTDRGVYTADAAGTTWSAANNGLNNLDVQSLAIDSQDRASIFAGTNGNGVLRATDPASGAAAVVSLVGWGVGAAALVAVIALGVVAFRVREHPPVRDRVWELNGEQWETAIEEALWTFGEANEMNLATKVPRRHLARALLQFRDRHSDDALTLEASPVALKFDNYPLAQRFLSLWKAAWEVVENEDAYKSVTGQMVDQLCTLLGFSRVEERSFQGLIGYVVRAAALRLKIPPRFPIIFIPRHEVTEADLDTLRDLMGVMNMVGYFALIVDLRDLPTQETHSSLKGIVHQAIHDFIVLDGSDIRDLLAARDHGRRLVDIILGQVDLTVVSPYVTSGPVPANMFFGREHELKTIVRTIRDNNFAIVGGRKIGKTSILARLHQLLQETPEFKPFYLDCQAIHTSVDFFGAVDTMWKTETPTPTVDGFRKMAMDLAGGESGRTIVMLFDEIDDLLQHDMQTGEQLFQTFRALSQEGHLRFIFCGEKVLNASLHDPALVFFNFCNLIALTYLRPEEARRVVLEPMQEMGILLEGDGQLADEIVELAAGHPNIVQYLCQKLIEQANLRHDRKVSRSDLRTVSESAQFAEYFAEVSWGHANALERLITLLMMERPQVTITEMAETLRERELPVTPQQLESAFDDLCLYSILRRDGPKYTFVAQALPDVLRRSQDVTGLLVSFADELKTNEGAN